MSRGRNWWNGTRLGGLLAFAAVLLATASPPALAATGNLATGKKLFKSMGCGSCHRLKPAGTKGTVGPSLDEFTPPYALIIARITNGDGAMPAFKRRLSKAQIKDIAAFVYNWTSRP